MQSHRPSEPHLKDERQQAIVNAILDEVKSLNRRHFLLSLPLLLALPRRLLAFGDYDRLEIGQVLYAGGNPQPRPHALRRLMWELDKRTSIEVRQDGAPVRLSEGADLFRHPLLYLAGDRAF